MRPHETRTRSSSRRRRSARCSTSPSRTSRWFRGIRFDSFRVLAAAQEPIPDDEIATVWDRYAAAHERLREIVEQRRDGDGTDVITEMAKGARR